MYHWSFYVSQEAIKKKKSTKVVGGGGVGGQIVVPRPLASASLTGRRQKEDSWLYKKRFVLKIWYFTK
jgi:hypothetical protein